MGERYFNEFLRDMDGSTSAKMYVDWLLDKALEVDRVYAIQSMERWIREART